MADMLEELLAKLSGAAPEEMEQMRAGLDSAIGSLIWVPQPGPQTEAYYCQADELLYGGEAGGGKTDLLIGLSLTAHKRSAVLRRTNREADKLVERYEQVVGSRSGYNGQKSIWRINGRIIDISGCQLEEDKQKFKGIAHDLKGFDELVDFTRSQYEFITTWTRSADSEQRSRIVATTNPPTTPDGMWVVERWAPWLDPNYPNPAQSGEIRWFVRVGDRDVEVDGPGQHLVGHQRLHSKSRTFIRAKLKDNYALAKSGEYERILDGLSEEYRSAYRDGAFDARLEDQPNQCIPTDWVRAAQARWTDRIPDGVPMCSMGVDASGGGRDPMCIARRYDGWYAHLIKVPGKELDPMHLGSQSAGIIVSHRRDGAVVIVDLGGGYGGSIVEHLGYNEIKAYGFKGALKSTYRDKQNHYRCSNVRTEAYWKFREGLDPSQQNGSIIALPPDPRLIAQLCAPTFKIIPDGIQLESKEDVAGRLGHSPDEADSVVMAWHHGPHGMLQSGAWATGEMGGGRGKRRPAVVMGRQHKGR
jgi:Terminase large subunit, T4likevirus-type, N-terminal